MDRLPELVESRLDAPPEFERASATPLKRRPVGRHDAKRVESVGAVEIARLSLVEQQRWFQTVVTHPESTLAGVALAGESAERVMSPLAEISAIEGLDVYHYAYRARLVECLIDDYPALAHALGEEGFEALAARYIVRHPSQSPNLNGFGRQVEAFLREEGAESSAFPADLAKLEWALVEILHAEEAAPLESSELAAIDPALWGQARFVPSPTLRLHRFEYPVNAYFQAFKNDEEPGADVAPAPIELAIYRQGFTLWRMELTTEMAGLLASLVSGVALGPALEAMDAETRDPAAKAEAARNVMAWFSSWVSGGFFARIELPETGA